MIRKWVRKWLGIDDDLKELREQMWEVTVTASEAMRSRVNSDMRMTALENSMRKVERDVKIVAPDYEASVEMEERKAAAVRERYEISAADARGITVEEYREQIAERRNKREADIQARAVSVARGADK